ncbi:MAG: SpoIID/LytB domain-containing protein [Patescibacteria group bacterium]
MPKQFILLFIVLVVSSLFLGITRARGDELDDINKQINDLTSALNQSKAATAPLETQLSGIKSRVAFIEADLINKQKDIDKSYKNLAKQQIILNQAIRNFYIKSYYNSPFLVFLSGSSATKITQILAYQKAATDQDKAIITNIALSINSLEQKQTTLKDENSRLALTKTKLDKIVGDAKGYQANLSSQIAVLSAKQQSILSQRLSSLNIPLTAYTTQGGCSSDLTNGKNPGFSGGFAFFTFGVPNRVGLNQYGAKGRAEGGQNAQQILSAYYNADYTTGYNTGINIHVVGSNEYGQSFDQNWSIEEYLKHIYEIPSNWPSESLKAQAIAARSYALAYTNNGSGSICPSQSCQVVKQEENSDAWKQAVSDTAGIVLTNGGAPIKAWFSSTHGGYVFASSEIGWSATAWTKNAQDATSGIGSFSDLQSNAYDKASPWFYCDWGSRSQYSGTAWLKSEEVADIANVLMLVARDGGTKEHLYQPDKPNPAGTDTWDASRVRQELSNRGGSPLSSANSVSIGADFGSGRTSSVNVNGNSFSGADFKTYFNLRAPANLQIVGPLYNVEKN